MDFKLPNLPSKCTWVKNAPQQSSPHTRVERDTSNKIKPNVLHVIGNTPMVRLNHIPQSDGIKCEMLAKCEFFNPGGSVKDRIGHRMIEDAEKKGLLKPGYTVIEPTSGNTGIGLAMACAIKGYRCIIVMPEKMSDEKVNVLKVLGAEIIRTPTEAAFNSPEGLIAVSQKIQKTIHNSVILDQYTNEGNPLAHYDLTATEIYEQCDGQVDMVVVGAGTGGTITGIGRKLKELCPSCVIVGVDPEGSILAQPETLNDSDVSFYEIEGIGYDFIPTVLDRSVVDQWIKVNDKEGLPMARRLIREEGLLCGGSSGAAMSCALKVASTLKEGQRCVVLLPDGIRNYMTKFVSDHWMEARNFLPCVNTQGHWWWDKNISVLQLQKPMSLASNTTCSKALNVMKKMGFDQAPIIDENCKLLGMVTLNNIMTKLINSQAHASDLIDRVILKKFTKVTKEANLGLISRILEKEPFVLVIDDDTIEGTFIKNEKVLGIISAVDLLHYITNNNLEDLSTSNGYTNGSDRS